LSNAEVDHLRVTKRNQELVRVLLDLTRQESSWREEVTDLTLKAQMEEVEAEHKKNRAKRDVIKGVISAVIVGSGIDWARDDTLRDLVLDESD
jgi:PHD/YefM family antitoxin component YafN of YafNO toxin-antitoxin module